MWHASVGFQEWTMEGRRSIPYGAWSPALLAIARAAALQLVRGVGGRPILVHRGSVALHVRRRLTEPEIEACRAASPVFFETPPTDPAGGLELIETIE